MIKCTPISNDKFNHVIYKIENTYKFYIFEVQNINEYTPPDYGLLAWDYVNNKETTTKLISKKFITYNFWYEFDLELNQGTIQSKIQLSDLSYVLGIDGNWIHVNDIIVGDKLSCFPSRNYERYKTITKINKLNTTEEFIDLQTESGEYLCNGVWLKCLNNG